MKTIDTRELQDRIDELETERDEFIDALPGDISDQEDTAEQKEQWDETDEGKELKELEDLKEEIGSEWKYGVALIPEADFTDYAQELAEEVGDYNPDAGWPTNCIDWERAARELKMDYAEITYQGEQYLYRT